VYDHVVTMLHKVEAASDLLVALQNTYLANVQIDVAEASNDANDVSNASKQQSRVALSGRGIRSLIFSIPLFVFLR
jgi:Tfp pilus assembly protein PilV